MPLPIDPPGQINVKHLIPALRDGRLAHATQATVLVVIARLAANSSQGWAAILPVDKIVDVRTAEIANRSCDTDAIRTFIMDEIENLATRGIIAVDDGMVTFTEEGSALIEQSLSQEMRFPCAPQPFSRPCALLANRLQDLYPYEVEAIRRLLHHCVVVGVWKGFRLSDITVGDEHAADIGIACQRLKERGLIAITVEGTSENPYNVIHSTPRLAELIYGTTEDSPG